MSTTDTVLLIILTSLMSLFFLLGIGLMIMLVKLVSSIRRVAVKAENVVDSVETAAETFKDVSGKMSVFKLLKNIIDLSNKSRR